MKRIFLSGLLLAQAVVVSCAAPQATEDRRLIPLFYVTDRKPIIEPLPKRLFGRRFAEQRSYGRVEGSIGISPANLGLPASWWPRDSTKRKRYFEVADHDPLEPGGLLPEIKAALDALDESDPRHPRTVILYVHGYNNSFVGAAQRTAQFALDLPVKGVPVVYSWPSRSRTAAYSWDETLAERAQPFVLELIRGLIAGTGAERLHIVAHSMGSRATLASLLELSREVSDLNRKVTTLTLLAPDIDALLFRRVFASKLPTLAGQVTLYTNRHDRALKASKKFNGGPALGWFRVAPEIAAGLVTVDTSAVGSSMLRHADFEREPAIMREIAADLTGVPLDRRPCLEPVKVSGGEYYRLDPARAGCPSSGPYPAPS